jgi:hypothetical protein
LSKTSDNLLAFDVYDLFNDTSFVSVMNLFTGDLRLDVGLVVGGYGAPSFIGDDSAIVYSRPANTQTEFSLVRQPLASGTMAPIGDPTIWLDDADFGVIYRRGAFQAPTETDACPDDPSKTEPGICGCGVPDTDSDANGVLDCLDDCPDDPTKTDPGECGCGVPDADSDGDGFADCIDECPNDLNKAEPRICGCGVPDTDGDADGVPDCIDGCPNDPNKSEPGVCGCGVPENACATPAPSATCGAGMGMIVLAFPVLGVLRLVPRRKRR